MTPAAVHPMTVERIADRQTTRYTCPVCQRCVEDGPDGLTILFRGDPAASHRAGVFALEIEELEAAAAPPARRDDLH
jgi:hypothetical protein